MQSNRIMKPPADGSAGTLGGAFEAGTGGTWVTGGAGGGALAAEDRLVDGAGGTPVW